MIIHLDLKERGYDIHLKRGILHTAADILSLQRTMHTHSNLYLYLFLCIFQTMSLDLYFQL